MIQLIPKIYRQKFVYNDYCLSFAQLLLLLLLFFIIIFFTREISSKLNET